MIHSKTLENLVFEHCNHLTYKPPLQYFYRFNYKPEQISLTRTMYIKQRFTASCKRQLSKTTIAEKNGRHSIPQKRTLLSSERSVPAHRNSIASSTTWSSHFRVPCHPRVERSPFKPRRSTAYTLVPLQKFFRIARCLLDKSVRRTAAGHTRA